MSAASEFLRVVMRLDVTRRTVPGRRGSTYVATTMACESLTADATTRTEATDALAALVLKALAAYGQPITLVIGGGPEYVNHIHVIVATAYGSEVRVIRNGKSGPIWFQGDTREQAIAQVLVHVGGDPTVVTV